MNWFAANNATGIPAPAASGTVQTFTINAGVTGLLAGNFSVKAYVGSGSGSGTTTTPPPAVSKCDLTGDGIVDVSDVQSAINQSLGTASCTNGDIDKDGSCNVVDVQRIINAALGGACVTTP
jgi:hypothetical protein